MGKAAKFKKFRRLAAQLPVIKIHAVIGSRVSGAELLKSGITEVEGKKVNEDKNYKGYRKKQVFGVPLNHNRKMKDIYNKQGISGVRGYVAAVIDYSKKQSNETA